MRLLDWFLRNAPGTVEEQKAAVKWLRACVYVQQGPAFMPSDAHKCKLILDYIDSLESAQPQEAAR